MTTPARSLSTTLGRSLFALGLAGFGALGFFAGDFVAGRAPAWPAGWPGKLAWAVVSGIVLIAAAGAIATQKKIRAAATTAGLLIFVWAALRNIPVMVASARWSGDWTNGMKPWVLTGGALAVIATMSSVPRATVLTWMSRVFLGAFMLLCGIQHFMWAQYAKVWVPAWMPLGALFWTYFTGAALIAGSIGLQIPQTARLAATMTAVMIFCFFALAHLPKLIADATVIDNWLAVFETISFTGVGLLIAGNLATLQSSRKIAPPLSS